MGLGKVIALDDLLDNARRRAIRLEISAMRDESSSLGFSKYRTSV